MTSKKLTITYDWVCHACAAENSKLLRQCHACGCSAFADVREMENHAHALRKPVFSLAREQAIRVLFWAALIGIAAFLKFIAGA
ncbi:hypothetical protein ACO0LM_23960 [Undibacterium sp. Di26W]|uniref:hypothetical protein n=1 Tax=Undibacterium sp. Di26W TaxID=3413035 RepID=UPI003BF072EB